MRTPLVAFGGLCGLFLQPHDLALFQRVVLVALVITRQFAIRDVHVGGYRLEGVTTTGLQIVILVEGIDMTEVAMLYLLRPELIIPLGGVQLIEPVKLDDFNEFRGIRRTGGIATSLQTFCPTLIVRQFQLKQ